MIWLVRGGLGLVSGSLGVGVVRLISGLCGMIRGGCRCFVCSIGDGLFFRYLYLGFLGVFLSFEVFVLGRGCYVGFRLLFFVFLVC